VLPAERGEVSEESVRDRLSKIKRFLADFRGDHAPVFPLCPLMLQKCAAR
jgi:hypothetical protein